MWKCGACGAMNEDTSKVCAACGCAAGTRGGGASASMNNRGGTLEEPVRKLGAGTPSGGRSSSYVRPQSTKQTWQNPPLGRTTEPRSNTPSPRRRSGKGFRAAMVLIPCILALGAGGVYYAVQRENAPEPPLVNVPDVQGGASATIIESEQSELEWNLITVEPGSTQSDGSASVTAPPATTGESKQSELEWNLITVEPGSRQSSGSAPVTVPPANVQRPSSNGGSAPVTAPPANVQKPSSNGGNTYNQTIIVTNPGTQSGSTVKPQTQSGATAKPQTQTGPVSVVENEVTMNTTEKGGIDGPNGVADGYDSGYSYGYDLGVDQGDAAGYEAAAELYVGPDTEWYSNYDDSFTLPDYDGSCTPIYDEEPYTTDFYDGVAQGWPNGYRDGYGEGYRQGYERFISEAPSETPVPWGDRDGLQDGYDAAYSYGYALGESDGANNGYSAAADNFAGDWQGNYDNFNTDCVVPSYEGNLTPEFDGAYAQDFSNGTRSGYEDGYIEGYEAGYETAYDQYLADYAAEIEAASAEARQQEYDAGASEGYSLGSQDGQAQGDSDGANNGWTDGRSDGADSMDYGTSYNSDCSVPDYGADPYGDGGGDHDQGFNDGYRNGYAEGYVQAYASAYDQAYSDSYSENYTEPQVEENYDDGAENYDDSGENYDDGGESNGGGWSAGSIYDAYNSSSFWSSYPNFSCYASDCSYTDGSTGDYLFSGSCPGGNIINCESYVSLRIDADSNSDCLAEVSLDEWVDVAGAIDGWLLCSYNGQYGWIKGDFVYIG